MGISARETAQLDFWRGEFGDSYAERNAVTPEHLAARTTMWARILRPTMRRSPTSILEVGANVGLNLRALRRLTSASLYALEPNAKARQRLIADNVIPEDRVLDGAASAIALPDAAVDLAFTCGVLCHIHPDDLPATTAEIHRVTSRYVACIEYFAVMPEEIPYHGHRDVLFKRDFGAYWLDRFDDLQVIDYGFFWRPVTGIDNDTWWLFEKRA